MTADFAFWKSLRRDTRGTALIETAILAPVLVMMAIGTFETSAMVARQSELQSAAEAAVEIGLAVSPDTQAELTAIKSKIKQNANLSDARVTLSFKYRCGSATTLTDTAGSCDEDDLNTYISIAMTDEYQPLWTEWGFGQAIEYEVNRTVQVS